MQFEPSTSFQTLFCTTYCLLAEVIFTVSVALQMTVPPGVGVGPTAVSVGVAVLVRMAVGPVVLVGPPGPTGVGPTEQPAPFCQFWIEMEMVLAAVPVTIRYMAPVES